MKIYIVLYHEIMGTPKSYHWDEMVLFTCSSMKKALGLIKSTNVCRWSWWEIQVQELDDCEWPEHIGYYGLRGGKLAKPPYEKCVEIFKTWSEKYPFETLLLDASSSLEYSYRQCPTSVILYIRS